MAAAQKLKLRALRKFKERGAGVAKMAGVPVTWTPAIAAPPSSSMEVALPEKEEPPRKKQKVGTGAAIENVPTLKPVQSVIPQVDFPSVWPPTMDPVPATGGGYHCVITGCSYTASKRDSVWFHVTQQHTKKRAMCPAANCGAVFGNPESMRKHLKKDHGQSRFSRKNE